MGGQYNPKAYKQRLKIYRRQTLPMLKYLDKKNRLKIVSIFDVLYFIDLMKLKDPFDEHKSNILYLLTGRRR